MSTNTTIENFTMEDGEMGVSVQYPSASDPVRQLAFAGSDDVSLSNFMARPVLLTSAVWTPNNVSPFSLIFNPWQLFFTNKRVSNRMNNYKLTKANMHVRFVINGSPFYYGMLMADYAPLTAYDDFSSYNTTTIQNAVQASQRMKVFIDPSTCCNTEMQLPFIWPYEALDATVGWGTVGQIIVRQLAQLKHSNGATQPITISVFGWASDVCLAAPTSSAVAGLVPQAGESEYNKPTFSNTASAVSKFTSAFKHTPYLGPYAMATSTVASSLGAMAKLFGFARPAILEAPTRMKPTFYSSLAVCDSLDGCEKLTVDSKQEVTVDPSVVGIGLPDEMTIASIASRESYITAFGWSTGAVAGNLLWTTRVTPLIANTVGQTIYMPASAFAAYPFAFWRGMVRFRFQVVASAHHKGRIRMVYDPVYVSGVESNTQITEILDLSKSHDFTVEVPWCQPQAYLPCDSVGISQYGTTAYVSQSPTTNGNLSLYVLNDLATPNSSVNNDIQINVFVSCNDLEVKQPRSLSNLVTSIAFTPQAGEDEYDGAMEPGCGDAHTEIVMGTSTDSGDASKIFFGERIVSFRQLLRRYNLHSSYLLPSTSSTALTSVRILVPDSPVPYGYSDLNMHTTSTGGKFNYVNATLLNYLQPAYLAVRGAQRSKYTLRTNSSGVTASLSVARNVGSANGYLATVNYPITTNSAYAAAAIGNRDDCMIGAATTVVSSQPVLEVEFPFYRNTRFDHARIAAFATPVVGTTPLQYAHKVEVVFPPLAASSVTTLDRHVSVGEDFSLIMFQGCPPMSYLVQPAA